MSIEPRIDEQKLLRTLRHVIDLLVNGRYDLLEQESSGRMLSSVNIEQEMKSWPATFISPPSDSIDDLLYGEVIAVDNTSPQRWAVDAKLWTKEENSWSDLTPSLTLIDSDADFYRYEIDNIHVL